MEEETEKYLYVYCITDKNFKIDMKGLRNDLIKKIEFNDVAILVSDYPTLRPAVEEKEAIHHAKILNKISEKTTIVPMSFGTVFKNEEILEAVLSKCYRTVKETLRVMEGKIELGIKVVKPEPEHKYNGEAKEILDSLNRLSINSVKGDLFSEKLLLNYSFLVEKDKFSKFSKRIHDLEKKHKDLKFIYTGPWPPYSFVNIKIAKS